jgi:hypothetical protein
MGDQGTNRTSGGGMTKMNWDKRLIGMLSGGILSLLMALLFHWRLLPVGDGDPAEVARTSFAIGGIVTLIAILLITFTGGAKTTKNS